LDQKLDNSTILSSLMKPDTDQLNIQFEHAAPEQLISYFCSQHQGKVVFTSSLGLEDQVLTDIIAHNGVDCRIITLDTGRLFYETHDLIQQTNDRYGIQVEVIFPDYADVEQMVREKGINLFYESVDNRVLCCEIRKNRPLQRAIKGMSVWVTGIRKGQSVTRQHSRKVEWDEKLAMLKINPLVDWSDLQVEEYIHTHKVPYNPLHDKGYPSIGCAPCTRAVESGENIRDGRWWWENPETKECGLHKKFTAEQM
jgi:phosphoadenosine phosphosulfate reductase